MIKKFCDKCEQMITSKNRPMWEDAGSLVPTFKINIKVEGRDQKIVMAIVPSNGGHTHQIVPNAEFCRYCIIDAITFHDDRPRPGSFIDSHGWMKLLNACNIGSKDAKLDDVLRYVTYLKEHAKQSIAASSP